MKNWYLLRTKPRQDKRAKMHLANQGLACYAPEVWVNKSKSVAPKHCLEPLFPGYVFLCGDEADRLAALRTNRIARVLDVVDQVRLRRELSHVERIVDADLPVELYPGLRQGCRCQVVSGSLAGLEGIVLRRRGPTRERVRLTAAHCSRKYAVGSP